MRIYFTQYTLTVVCTYLLYDLLLFLCAVSGKILSQCAETLWCYSG